MPAPRQRSSGLEIGPPRSMPVKRTIAGTISVAVFEPVKKPRTLLTGTAIHSMIRAIRERYRKTATARRAFPNLTDEPIMPMKPVPSAAGMSPNAPDITTTQPRTEHHRSHDDDHCRRPVPRLTQLDLLIAEPEWQQSISEEQTKKSGQCDGLTCQNVPLGIDWHRLRPAGP